MRLVLLGRDDYRLDGIGQLVGIAHWPPGAIRQFFQAILPVAVEDIVADLARYAEIRQTSLFPCPPEAGRQIVDVPP